MLEHNTFVRFIVFVSQTESNWPQECRTACVNFVFYLFFVFVFWIVLYLYHRMNKIGLKNAGVRVQLQAAASPDLAYLLFTSSFPPPPDLKSPNYYEKLKSFDFHIIPPAHLPIIWKAWTVGFITKKLQLFKIATCLPIHSACIIFMETTSNLLNLTKSQDADHLVLIPLHYNSLYIQLSNSVCRVLCQSLRMWILVDVKTRLTLKTWLTENLTHWKPDSLKKDLTPPTFPLLLHLLAAHIGAAQNWKPAKMPDVCHHQQGAITTVHSTGSYHHMQGAITTAQPCHHHMAAARIFKWLFKGAPKWPKW